MGSVRIAGKRFHWNDLKSNLMHDTVLNAKKDVNEEKFYSQL